MATWAMRKRYEWIDARLAAREPFNRDDIVAAYAYEIAARKLREALS